MKNTDINKFKCALYALIVHIAGNFVASSLLFSYICIGTPADPAITPPCCLCTTSPWNCK